MSLNEQEEVEPTGEFAASIRDFRAAVTHIAEQETARPFEANWLAPARQRRRSHRQRVALGWACALLLCVATVPLMTHSTAPAVRPVKHTTATAVVGAPSQSGLLEQVDEDVSESAPSSLAPLTEMDNWNSTSDTDETTLSTENTNAGRK